MIVFFLPNGIGDALMAIPTIRRIIQLRGVSEVCLVTKNLQQSNLYKIFIDKNIRTIERFDSKSYPHARLWLKLLLIRKKIIVAPLVSAKISTKIFFLTLFSKVLVPQHFCRNKILYLEPAKICLSSYKGHQCNYYIHFIAEVEPKINVNKVIYSELNPLIKHSTKQTDSTTSTSLKIVLGISCGEKERHKIPSPDFFKKLIYQISLRKSLDVLLIGSSSDIPLIDEVMSDNLTGIKFNLLIDHPLELVIQEMEKYDIGISGPTGQGHMMATAQLPMIILSGVADIFSSGPYVEFANILGHKYRCGPCYQEGFNSGCGLVKCMDTLDIYKAVELIDEFMLNKDYGKNWLDQNKHFAVKSIATIRKIHSLPDNEWINETQ